MSDMYRSRCTEILIVSDIEIHIFVENHTSLGSVGAVVWLFPQNVSYHQLIAHHVSSNAFRITNLGLDWKNHGEDGVYNQLWWQTGKALVQCLLQILPSGIDKVLVENDRSVFKSRIFWNHVRDQGIVSPRELIIL